MRIAAAALLCLTIGLIGCSSKKTQGLGGEGSGAPIGDSRSKTSIEDMASNNGTLTPDSQHGPLSDIHFGYNDYTVQPQDSSILRTNASWLQAHPDSKVQVEGNCDERGSEEYNIALGAKRAQSAKDYLTTLGISPSRISTISYGKELPLCHEQNESCWQQNRRDHFVVSGGQASR